MNPCATSFKPKVTYADTVKAGLPQPTPTDKSSARCSDTTGKQAVRQRMEQEEVRHQVGSGVTHYRESSRHPTKESLRARTEPVLPSDQPPNPAIHVSCEDKSVLQSIIFNPHLRHLHEGWERNHSPSRNYLESELSSEGTENLSSDLSEQAGSEALFSNPLLGCHTHPPMAKRIHNHGHPSWECSASNSTSPMLSQFYPPPLLPPPPGFFPSLPPTQHPNLPYLCPPPLIPFPGTYTFGGYPFPYPPFPSPSPVPLSRQEQAHYSSAPHSRSSSRRAARWGTQSRPSSRNSRETSIANTRRTPIRSAQDTPVSRIGQLKKPMGSPALSALPVEEEGTPAQSLNAMATLPDRGRSRYRLVSTVTNDNSTQSGRNGQPREKHNFAHEASSEINKLASTITPANNIAEDPMKDAFFTDIFWNLGLQSKEVGEDLHQSGSHKALELAKQTGTPPPNAPTAPASFRRQVNPTKGQSQTSLIHKPAEPGSWSQSKRWISQETKERAAFQKLMLSLHHMGADKSPFIPQTPAALTAFKIAHAEARSRKLTLELRRKVQEMTKRKKDTKPPMTLEVFEGKLRKDALSPVFAADNCFNKDLPSGDGMQADWPSLAELKEEGDKRAARYGRYFPLPRLNVVESRILELEQQSAYNKDGSISWEKKAVKLGSRFIRPVSLETELSDMPPEQLLVQEVHGPLQDLLQEIDMSDSDDLEQLYEKTEEEVDDDASRSESGQSGWHAQESNDN